MNKKVVVFWVFCIVLFVILGLYGLLNKNLLVNEAIDKEYVPKKVSDNMKSCNISLNNEKVKYDFVIDSNNNIVKVMMTYTGKSENLDNFEAASKINSWKLNGIKSTLSGGSVDFVLLVTVTLNDLDLSVFSSYKETFDKLNMNISNIKNYNEYTTYLKTVNASFVCE